MTMPDVPDCIPRARGSFSAWLGRQVLQLLGWQLEGTISTNKKMIIPVAPHTSNWDFVIAMSVMLMLNLEIKFMGKDAIFVWPFKSLLIKLGGIAIDRNHSHGVVEQMVTAFNNHDKLY